MVIIKNSLPRKAIIFDLQKLVQLHIVCLQLFNKNEDLNGTSCKRSPFTPLEHGGHLNKEQNTLSRPNCLFVWTGIIYDLGKALDGSWLLFSYHQLQIILPAEH